MYPIFKRLRPFIFAGLLLLLAACNSGPAPQQPKAFASVASVQISADATQADIETLYGGQAFVFKPEAGFAVLGFSEEQDRLTTLNTTSNIGAYSSPETSALGTNAWAGGRNAWAGGLKTWAGGWNTWAGGSTVPGLPSENSGAFGKIRLSQAHTLSKNYGAGIKIAVLDTGIDTSHPMFTGRLAPSGEWKDYVGNDTNPQEVSGGNGYGHGTAVAGLIAQVAPRATILPIRVLNQHGVGNVDHIIAAIDWAIQKGAKVINLSLGTTSYVSALHSMVDYAASKGVYIVAAAGNTGNTNMLHPAASSLSITKENFLLGVGSVDNLDKRSSFSSYGPDLEYVAPGQQLYSAFPGNQLAHYTGTSFATPLVSGAVALFMSDSTNKSMNFDDPVYNGSDDSSFSYGRLNIQNGYNFIPR